MNLTVTTVNTPTVNSQNISSRGFFGKLFRASKQPTKDVFISTIAATAVGATSAAVTNQVQNAENDTQALKSLFFDLRDMHRKASLLGNKFEILTKNINENLKELPQDSTREFISEVMNCITVALEKNPKELCSCHRFGDGAVMGNAGRFLLETSQGLVLLKQSSEFADDKEFAEQVQKDVLISKNIMELINNGDYEAADKMGSANENAMNMMPF